MQNEIYNVAKETRKQKQKPAQKEKRGPNTLRKKLGPTITEPKKGREKPYTTKVIEQEYYEAAHIGLPKEKMGIKDKSKYHKSQPEPSAHMSSIRQVEYMSVEHQDDNNKLRHAQEQMIPSYIVRQEQDNHHDGQLVRKDKEIKGNKKGHLVELREGDQTWRHEQEKLEYPNTVCQEQDTHDKKHMIPLNTAWKEEDTHYDGQMVIKDQEVKSNEKGPLVEQHKVDQKLIYEQEQIILHNTWLQDKVIHEDGHLVKYKKEHLLEHQQDNTNMLKKSKRNEKDLMVEEQEDSGKWMHEQNRMVSPNILWQKQDTQDDVQQDNHEDVQVVKKDQENMINNKEHQLDKIVMEQQEGKKSMKTDKKDRLKGMQEHEDKIIENKEHQREQNRLQKEHECSQMQGYLDENSLLHSASGDVQMLRVVSKEKRIQNYPRNAHKLIQDNEQINTKQEAEKTLTLRQEKKIQEESQLLRKNEESKRHNNSNPRANRQRLEQERERDRVKEKRTQVHANHLTTLSESCFLSGSSQLS